MRLTLPIAERMQRWETDARYYVVHLHRDLFGAWGLTLAWGGRGSRLGSQHHHPCADLDAAVRLMETTAQRRTRRGYRLVYERVYYLDGARGVSEPARAPVPARRRG